jgi:hypothetical protein
MSTQMLAGITQCGEVGDSRRTKGPKDNVGRCLGTAWCWCHLSDLALQSVLEVVPELEQWLNVEIFLGAFADHVRNSTVVTLTPQKSLDTCD